MNFYLIIIIIILILMSIYLIYKYVLKNKKKKGFIENNEYKIMKEKKNGNVYIFYAKWCPHSKKSLTEFENIKKKYENHPQYDIIFNEIDAEENNDMADAYKIDSYPTIVLNYKNKKYIYDANLNETTFKIFIDTIMV